MSALKFDTQGLVPAVIQDEEGLVLMLGYMNQEAMRLTLETGKVHFWSRSRNALWCKGETSGHTQRVVEMRLDCDGDAVLLKVRQEVAACHTGHRSCFYRAWAPEGWQEVESKLFDPARVYGAKEDER
jgi:phosphoribosyl-AMP cyclohydrolase